MKYQLYLFIALLQIDRNTPPPPTNTFIAILSQCFFLWAVKTHLRNNYESFFNNYAKTTIKNPFDTSI